MLKRTMATMGAILASASPASAGFEQDAGAWMEFVMMNGEEIHREVVRAVCHKGGTWESGEELGRKLGARWAAHAVSKGYSESQMEAGMHAVLGAMSAIAVAAEPYCDPMDGGRT